MHKFLRAVGFSDISKEEMTELIEKIVEHPTTEKISRDSEGNDFAEITKEFGEMFGISLRGTYNEENVFEMEYYYPFFCG